eukprot:Hpha_TRINITY_DN15900_c0_g14::TRINITY_DN15900_c0_g14_i2::g.73761::m.73761
MRLAAALAAVATAAAQSPADRSLCFVIDDTGSMGPDIDQVRRVADRLLYLSDAPHFVLVGFNDPVPVNMNVSTTDRQLFYDSYHRIEPSGGGDCPELFYEGAIRGVGRCGHWAHVGVQGFQPGPKDYDVVFCHLAERQPVKENDIFS